MNLIKKLWRRLRPVCKHGVLESLHCLICFREAFGYPDQQTDFDPLQIFIDDTN